MQPQSSREPPGSVSLLLGDAAMEPNSPSRGGAGLEKHQARPAGNKSLFFWFPLGSGGCSPPGKGQVASCCTWRVQHQHSCLAGDLWDGICHFPYLCPERHSGLREEAEELSQLQKPSSPLYMRALPHTHLRPENKLMAENTSSHTWKK